MKDEYIASLEARIAELEEPILCHKCNDHIDGDGAICGVCASTQDTVINEQRERIAELEKQSRSEALIRCELEDEIDFFTRSMHFTPANTYEVLAGRIRELEDKIRELTEKAERLENANSELKITVNTKQNRIKELEARLAEKEKECQD